MARATRDPNDGQAGVEFVREDDGSITARNLETGLARRGDSRAAALAQLAEVLALHEGRGESVTDADLREMGLDPDAEGEEEPPEFLR